MRRLLGDRFVRVASDDRLGLVFVHIGVFKSPSSNLAIKNAAAGAGQPFLIHLVYQLAGRAHARAAQNIRARVGGARKVKTPVGLDDAGIAQLLRSRSVITTAL